MTTKLFLGLFALGIPFMTSAADKLVVEGDFDVQGDFLPANGITFADGSSMVNAPDKVVYINEGDDITAILSSEEENVWYRIGPGAFTLTANINARDGCRYSGAGKDITIINGAYMFFSYSSSITVESLTATGNNWFESNNSLDEIVIRDCVFNGDSLGNAVSHQTYWIYDSAFSGSNAFESITTSIEINAYNSTFEFSGSFSTLDGSVNIRAYNCKFLGSSIATSGYIGEHISATFYNCELNVSSSFSFAVEYGYPSGDFLFHSSKITGSNNFVAYDDENYTIVEDEFTVFYSSEINGELITKTQDNAIIDAASVGIGTNTPTAGVKLDVEGDAKVSGILMVDGSIVLAAHQGDIPMYQPPAP